MMCTSCVHHVYIMCTSCVHHMYVTCTSHVHHVYIMCTSLLPRHPQMSALQSSVSAPLILPRDLPLDLHIKAFVGYKTRYDLASPRCSPCLTSPHHASPRTTSHFLASSYFISLHLTVPYGELSYLTYTLPCLT